MEQYNGILNEEELEQVKKIFELKRNLASYMDMEKFIDEAREIIENSNNFDFRNSSAKEFIDNTKPVFVLSIVDNDLYQDLNNREEKEGINIINDLLYDEIIKKLSERLLENLKLQESVFNEVPESLTSSLLSNIYVLRSNIKQNNLQIFFFV